MVHGMREGRLDDDGLTLKGLSKSPLFIGLTVHVGRESSAALCLLDNGAAPA